MPAWRFKKKKFRYPRKGEPGYFETQDRSLLNLLNQGFRLCYRRRVGEADFLQTMIDAQATVVQEIILSNAERQSVIEGTYGDGRYWIYSVTPFED